MFEFLKYNSIPTGAIRALPRLLLLRSSMGWAFECIVLPYLPICVQSMFHRKFGKAFYIIWIRFGRQGNVEMWFSRFAYNLNANNKHRYTYNLNKNFHLVSCTWILTPNLLIISLPHNHTTRGLFHKTFFFVIYGHFAVNYGIFSIYEQIYGQNLAVTTNP